MRGVALNDAWVEGTCTGEALEFELSWFWDSPYTLLFYTSFTIENGLFLSSRICNLWYLKKTHINSLCAGYETAPNTSKNSDTLW